MATSRKAAATSAGLLALFLLAASGACRAEQQTTPPCDGVWLVNEQDVLAVSTNYGGSAGLCQFVSNPVDDDSMPPQELPLVMSGGMRASDADPNLYSVITTSGDFLATLTQDRKTLSFTRTNSTTPTKPDFVWTRSPLQPNPPYGAPILSGIFRGSSSGIVAACMPALTAPGAVACSVQVPVGCTKLAPGGLIAFQDVDVEPYRTWKAFDANGAALTLKLSSNGAKLYVFASGVMPLPGNALAELDRSAAKR